MGARIRIGLWSAGAILLVVLVFAGLVWRDADGHVPIRRDIRPAVAPNEVVVRAELALWSGLIVHPGVDVSVKCSAESDGHELTFVCIAKRTDGRRL